MELGKYAAWWERTHSMPRVLWVWTTIGLLIASAVCLVLAVVRGASHAGGRLIHVRKRKPGESTPLPRDAPVDEEAETPLLPATTPLVVWAHYGGPSGFNSWLGFRPMRVPTTLQPFVTLTEWAPLALLVNHCIFRAWLYGYIANVLLMAPVGGIVALFARWFPRIDLGALVTALLSFVAVSLSNSFQAWKLNQLLKQRPALSTVLQPFKAKGLTVSFETNASWRSQPSDTGTQLLIATTGTKPPYNFAVRMRGGKRAQEPNPQLASVCNKAGWIRLLDAIELRRELYLLAWKQSADIDALLERVNEQIFRPQGFRLRFGYLQRRRPGCCVWFFGCGCVCRCFVFESMGLLVEHIDKVGYGKGAEPPLFSLAYAGQKGSASQKFCGNGWHHMLWMVFKTVASMRSEKVHPDGAAARSLALTVLGSIGACALGAVWLILLMSWQSAIFAALLAVFVLVIAVMTLATAELGTADPHFAMNLHYLLGLQVILHGFLVFWELILFVVAAASPTVRPTVGTPLACLVLGLVSIVPTAVTWGLASRPARLHYLNLRYPDPVLGRGDPQELFDRQPLVTGTELPTPEWVRKYYKIVKPVVTKLEKKVAV